LQFVSQLLDGEILHDIFGESGQQGKNGDSAIGLVLFESASDAKDMESAPASK
jgi:hypothetical protein